MTLFNTVIEKHDIFPFKPYEEAINYLNNMLKQMSHITAEEIMLITRSDKL